ncbi:EAL domain-containing protein [Bacillus tuaregi]|uniref:EAL domain-containing protein n=1 Tax=Bacillus tuaregi TaxID=1816695 RepID=UPI0008F87968|nr:EAL domain-containing protein [Bacillus tuaregi]
MDIFNLNMIINQIDFHHEVQPITNLMSKQVFGFEFLLRTRHCQNPELLFKYAKKHDRHVDLDIKSIFKILETAKHESDNLQGFLLFINICPSTLLDPAFHHNLHKFISVTHIKPSSVVLEISEIHDGISLSMLKKTTAILKKQGFLIALDDIGKGESTIKAVLEIEPNIGKVDRYFAKDIAQSSRKQKAIQCFLQFFGNDIKMVLEGFESKEDLDSAIELGVRFGQGYYLGKPNPFEYYLPNIEKN